MILGLKEPRTLEECVFYYYSATFTEKRMHVRNRRYTVLIGAGTIEYVSRA